MAGAVLLIGANGDNPLFQLPPGLSFVPRLTRRHFVDIVLGERRPYRQSVTGCSLDRRWANMTGDSTWETCELYDVIVVGAGPAGNIAASRLSSLGYDVAVLDRRHDIGDKLCTGIVGPECYRRFPPDPSIVHNEAVAATVVSPAGERYRIARDQTQAFVLDRVAYVRSLADTASAVGAEYRLGHQVTSVEASNGHVDVVARSDSGRHNYRARMLVIGSGFGTPLIEMAGVGNGRRRDHLVGTQAEVEAPGLDSTEVYLGKSVAPGSFGWVVPSSASRALVGTVTRERSDGEMERFLSTLQRSGKVQRVVKPLRRWGIPVRPLSKTYADRVLVAGDAAGFAKPTTGGGIYYALLSGEMAAETAHDAFTEGDLSAGRLKGYQRRWKAVFGKELRTGYYARVLFEALGDRQIERLLRLCVEAQEEIIGAREFSFDWHSKVILKALRRGDLAKLFTSVGPAVVPALSRLVRAGP